MKAEWTISGTASSRSASESTSTQFFPPISETTRLTWRWPSGVSAEARTISSPTALEPVKAITWAPGCRTRAAPASPYPGNSASASAGTPAPWSASTSAWAVAGDCSAGLGDEARGRARVRRLEPGGVPAVASDENRHFERQALVEVTERVQERL